MKRDLLAAVIAEVAGVMIDHADELTRLDRAIGDGDHGVNVRRGFQAVLGQLDDFRRLPLPEAVGAVGKILVMTVGGAFGPLVGTALMTLGRALPHQPDRGDLSAAARTAFEAVKARGRSDVGHKTLLDVLGPVCEALADGLDPAELKTVAATAAERTIAMQAMRGRAAFLGERSIGHMDPGARSVCLMIAAAVDAIDRAEGARMNVGVVIVSHSPKVAEGAADMVRQMVGDAVPLAWTGGNAEDRLGTDVARILTAMREAWSPAGLVILVDLGSAETNSEIAIETLPPDQRGRILICNAPVVEGAVLAATKASGGASVEAVKRAAEDVY